MAKVYIDGKAVALTAGQSVLNALLGAGYRIPYSCQSGVCQSCLMHCERGELPAQATAGLSASQREKKLFLSCSCFPDSDVSVTPYAVKEELLIAEVMAKRHLSPRVLELQLHCPLSYHAGQYINVWRDQTIARTYSIASIPSDPVLSLHIEVRAGGQFSAWADQQLAPGDRVNIQGPMGDCTYQAEPDQSLLLAGTGTGIAPLYGIAREALARAHTGPIHIVYCAREPEGLYWQQALTRLARHHSNVHLQCLVAKGGDSALWREANAYQTVRADYTPLNNYQIYLCGAPSFVAKMRKQCFLAGARPRSVFCDAFEPSR
ncbi:2Fe-2S iron-sulfur cluster binding domain-containing protein [Gilvimarinus algae]|uniref:2Fe-2S iron-sulfur cluster binding domain-containing protein n=1 Tax=Gilvimarinus algae TaxID=3058037 RepID=A0ABT8THN3_9GAMM|nr:2Fe-2S iron-sulfur cluster binding domain-containing protein [Gilvimarinus sp. SDUM040014]MDO3383609.1 2Fe-2S iron-sulfur cluster binding domain-containing protein [Gilvimarinus sp. SDUM040014]